MCSSAVPGADAQLVAIDAEDDVDVLDTETLDSNFYFYGTQVTESRVFAQGYSYDSSDPYGTYSVLVIGDIGGDDIDSAVQDLPSQEYLWSVAAQDEHLVLASYGTPGIHVLDATDLWTCRSRRRATSPRTCTASRSTATTPSAPWAPTGSRWSISSSVRRSPGAHIVAPWAGTLHFTTESRRARSITEEISCS